MARAQPFYVPVSGGLALNRNKFQLMESPGVATELVNMEPTITGGYRRINGYSRFGSYNNTLRYFISEASQLFVKEGSLVAILSDGSQLFVTENGLYFLQEGTAAPLSEDDPVEHYFVTEGSIVPKNPVDGSRILGVTPYALGVVVVVSEGIYYSEDGENWTQVNVDTGDAGMSYGEVILQDPIVRPDQGESTFAICRGLDDNVSNPYGALYIATFNNPLAKLIIDDTSGTRVYKYKELNVVEEAAYIAEVNGHLIVVDYNNQPNTFFYSSFNNYDDFEAIGSGNAVVVDQIIGIKPFRDILYIFSRRSIRKCTDLGLETMQIVDVTSNLGCVSGRTIQEIGGDLIFLSHDGFRSVSATERLQDVEVGRVALGVQPIVQGLVNRVESLTLNSIVIKTSNQYRLYYSDGLSTNKGLIGTLMTDASGNRRFDWSEIDGISVSAIGVSSEYPGGEASFHGDFTGRIFRHDFGNAFDETPIAAKWKSPDFHLGDLGSLKTLRYIKTSIDREGDSNIFGEVRFDFNSSSVAQPPIFFIDEVANLFVFGSAFFGSAIFNARFRPFERIPLIGSGHTVSIKFYSEGLDSPYTIHGYHLEFVPSGRK